MHTSLVVGQSQHLDKMPAQPNNCVEQSTAKHLSIYFILPLQLFLWHNTWIPPEAEPYTVKKTSFLD